MRSLTAHALACAKCASSPQSEANAEYHVEAGELAAYVNQMEMEVAFLKDGVSAAPLYLNPSTASEAATALKKFTETWNEPFDPKYPYESAWCNKKENKGKKPRPAGPYKPPMKNDVEA